MPTEVIMPALGMAQETGKLLRWMKSEGDAVTKGEPLMEIETDKVTVEIEAPSDGVLAGVSAAEGDDIPVGQAIAYLLAEGEDLPEAAAVPVATQPSAAPVVAATTNGSSIETSGRRVLAFPKARRLARERGVRIEELKGTGPHGAIQAADVVARPTADRSAAGTQPVV